MTQLTGYLENGYPNIKSQLITIGPQWGRARSVNVSVELKLSLRRKELRSLENYGTFQAGDNLRGRICHKDTQKDARHLTPSSR
ncbi:hypothetical protein J6590_039637 [Homalodisca vitripennis]|nr:hypothetical protein J6590_039637 [Homalodisca vitripennis]